MKEMIEEGATGGKEVEEVEDQARTEALQRRELKYMFKPTDCLEYSLLVDLKMLWSPKT